MKKAYIGTVDHVSAGVSGAGESLIYIDGRAFVAVINFQRFPIKAGSNVEYRTQGNRCEILAVQADLLDIRAAGCSLFASLERGE